MTRKAVSGSEVMNWIAQVGLRAIRMPGSIQIPRKPSSASAENQMINIGPKTRPIFAVPKRWIENRPINMPIVIGMTKGVKAAVTSSSPSSALSTEIAGVIAPSPYNKAAPNSPATTRIWRVRDFPDTLVCSSDTRAMIPPSPSLSARITTSKYLIEMTMISDHVIIERTPKI